MLGYSFLENYLYWDAVLHGAGLTPGGRVIKMASNLIILATGLGEDLLRLSRHQVKSEWRSSANVSSWNDTLEKDFDIVISVEKYTLQN